MGRVPDPDGVETDSDLPDLGGNDTRADLKTWLAKSWREDLRPLLVVVLVLCTLRSAVADWNDVPTGSMKPTIVEGDRILVNKLAFTDWWLMQWSGPQRGDVVVCFSPANGDRLVKRVIGLPGDRVEMRRNVLLVNGRPADYGPLDPDIGRRACTLATENGLNMVT